ncbi:MAG: methyltransferase domain-containing protein [Magnetococcales bacterium]|nr:methyltransferase domain-containing protein [Magnetococcales bacterium]
MSDKQAGNTEQLDFWRGEFGSTYTERNAADAWQLQARVRLWSRIMRAMDGRSPQSILEVGANLGNNLRALSTMCSATFHALEPNPTARERLVDDQVVAPERVLDGFASEIPLDDGAVELAFTSGVLIHIHPDDLAASCGEIYRVSSRYIVCIEYFSDKPEVIPYRGHTDKLFKRDFGGFWMDQHPDLQLLDYGFAWKRMTGLDNLTWWVFEKR